MQKSNIILLVLVSFMFVACGSSESDTKVVKKTDTDTYLGSRVDAIKSAKEAVKKSDKRVEEQDKLLENISK